MVLTYPLASRSAVMAASTAARSAPWGKLVAMTVSMAAMVSGPDLRMASVASTDLALKEEMVDMADLRIINANGVALRCCVVFVAVLADKKMSWKIEKSQRHSCGF